jgi:hypothetical protein
MVDVPVSSSPVSAERTRLRRTGAGPAAFWILFVVEMALVIGILGVVLSTITPIFLPLAATGDRAVVREAILARLNGAIVEALVEVRAGETARSSNVRGFALNGTVYYYYLEGERNFDPLSRGLVSASQVNVALRDTSGPRPLVIYTLRQ